ncbi:hypothetical protein [Terriglobus sp. TAA 43]|uniref:hypothetical protein n=1 Tax=Terriglobus sp. TAA 43 TaxID=278961 RepID=UPI0006463AA9|nr:hypothetical protein [Terriglobus sp. TAA 43]
MKRSIALIAMAFAPLLAAAQAATPLNAVLITNVDARKAKVGDTVKVRGYSGFVAIGGQRIPPGAIILGHVTEVSKLSKGTTDSRLTIVFDQAELAGGQTVPVRLGIAGLAAAPPVAGLSAPSSLDADSRSPFESARSTIPTPAVQRNPGTTNGAPNDTRVVLPTPEQIDRQYHDRPNSLPADPVVPVATVGSTIPGITLQPNSTLVSATTNINLRSTTPLALLPIPTPQ